MSQSTLTDVSSSPDAAVETVIGEKYKVAKLLGEGGMGAVYEAENSWTKRRVAVKLMRPEFARDPESVQRFLREAQSAAQIDHPNVVSVLDMGRDTLTGSLFIVQEYLVGQDLAAYLDERGAVPPDEALELILPVIDGLASAHALGVVHRDLKPENIFLVRGRGGRVVPKIIDFGIAKALRPRENEFRTIIGQTMGTPAYMSPEQARGDLDIDGRTDVWALGVVLYQLLSGQLPYPYDDNPQVMLAHVITQEPKSLDLIAPSLPPDLRAVVALALTRDRARRLPDMPTFYVALTATSAGSRARDTLRRSAPVELPPGSQPPSLAPPARRVTDDPIATAPTTPRVTPASSAQPSNTPPVALDGIRPSRAPIVVVVILLGLIALGALAAIVLRAPTPATPTSPPVAQPSVTPVATPIAPPTPAAPQAPIAPQNVAPTPTPATPTPTPAVAPVRPPPRRPQGTSERGANGAAIIE